jgi:ectoine hydroxylase-related dioxygenase (phytanoyl-CoA dioxygenase family)
VERLGFATIPNFLTPRAVAYLRTTFEAAPLIRSRAGVRHALRHPAFNDLARDPRLLQIAQEILSSEAIPFHATLFEKSPDANWLVVWHQDTALPLRRRRESPGWGPWSVKDKVIYAHAPASALQQVLSLRIHLDDSTSENGPLRVLPKTHSLGVLNDDAIHDLASKISPVECIVASGGVLVMRPLLVHASSKSRIDAPRRVLHIEYATSLFLAERIELAIDGCASIRPEVDDGGADAPPPSL